MYHHLDAAVVRAAAEPPGVDVGPWPDLTGQGASPASWRRWLEQALHVPGFEAALEQASPSLAERVYAILGGHCVSERDARRVVLAVMRYRLRACGRATPFGLFAGVAPARITSTSTVRLGTAHRAIAGVDARWLAAVVEDLEREPTLRPRLTVTANNLVVERDGHMVLGYRCGTEDGGAPMHMRVRAAPPVRAAMDLAGGPIRLGDLAAKLAARFARVPDDVIDALLADMVAQRLLLTNLRPPMTRSDPLGHVVTELDAMSAQDLGPPAALLARLREIAAGSARHDHASTPAAARAERASVAAVMSAVCPAPGPALGVDLRVDWDVAVPRAVAAEVANAAAVLVRLAPHPSLSPGWIAWHGRFLDRYGPRALVPLLDVVDADTGVGYPAGYLDGPPAPPPGATGRDAKLLALAQHAALRHRLEVRLDEAMVADLSVVDPGPHIQSTTEMIVRISAVDEPALSRGDFTLALVGVSRAAGTMTGRFLHLFDGADRDRMRAVYAGLPTASPNAILAQISACTPYTGTANVARTPRITPHLICAGEYHDRESKDRIALDDLAVTADARRIHLVSLTRRRPIQPIVFNAVEPLKHTHPLVRFLVEAPNALHVPCAAFDWGAAAGLPFLPALRHGRTIVSPARWLLPAADLPGPDAGWREWNAAFTAWRNDVALPPAVFLGDGDRRIGLDLAEPAHVALLRAQVERTGTAVLRAAPSADAAGWIGGNVHEVVVPLAATRSCPEAPSWLATAEVVRRDHGHLPGRDGRFYVKLYARHERQSAILTRHLPHLLAELGPEAQWWFLRYRDPDEHLRLRLTVPTQDVATAAARIAAWSHGLREAGLLARVQWDTDFPETTRFGGTAATGAAGGYFAADSAAALAQLTAGDVRGGPDPRAVTAASMLDITIGLIGDTPAALAWVFRNAGTHTRAPDRALYDQAVRLANPTDRSALAAHPGGERVVASWERRRDALIVYRRVLEDTATAPTSGLLPDLLHLHYVRMFGVDPEGERACLHLTRAAALSWTARAERRP